MKIIPLSAVPSQKLSVLLGNQNCQIKVYQKTTGLYIDVSVNDVPLVSGVVCRNAVPIVRYAYLGFSGDLLFLDTRGSDDPQYLGLAGRFELIYFAAGELA